MLVALAQTEAQLATQNRARQARSPADQQAQQNGPPGAAWLAQLDALTRRVEDTLGPLTVLAAVSPNKPIRDAADACDRAYQAHAARYLQNAAVYARLRQVVPADAIDQRFARDALDAFEDAGVALPAAARQRLRRIQRELTRLMQRFDRRLREDRTQLRFSVAELAGVPPDLWQHAPRDKQSRWHLSVNQSTANTLLDTATQPATRRRMWRAYQSLGGHDNIVTLTAIVTLRRELAERLGFASYADFALRRRMVRSADHAEAFLATVQAAVRDRELSDVAALRAAKAQHLQQPVETTVLHRWDTAFYAERVRHANHAVEQENLRRYFPPDASMAVVFRLAEHLFGVTVQPMAAPDAPALWHADAQSFVVTDSDTGAPLGTLLIDLYPRPDKFGGAAVWGFRNASTLVGRRPTVALVANLDRQGLTMDEWETLLHEFGHALHALLSQTRYAAQSGTNVQLDFAEAPSQMLEDWVYEPQVLALFREVCPQCLPMPPELLTRVRAARRFGFGIELSRQRLFASYDLALHGRTPFDPLPLWAQMEAATPLGHVTGTRFPAGFDHIASNYAAGYYSYLWSLVLAEDLRTAFSADRLDAAVGRRLRTTLLENGGQIAPADLMQRFLGRATDSSAFFDALKK